jgi:hypothetical protein
MSISPLLSLFLSGITALFFLFHVSLGTIPRLLELFVFAGVRGLCTYRIEKRIYTPIKRKMSSQG